MNITYIIVWIIAGVGFGALIGRASKKQGYGFWPWVFLSLLTSPLIAWIIFTAIKPIRESKKLKGGDAYPSRDSTEKG
jgi:uncharacterized membrane protein YkvI